MHKTQNKMHNAGFIAQKMMIYMLKKWKYKKVVHIIENMTNQ